MDQDRIDLLRRFHTGGQPETIMGWSQVNDAIQECLDTIERQAKELNRSQQALHKAESDRESLLAEVERLKDDIEAHNQICEFG